MAATVRPAARTRIRGFPNAEREAGVARRGGRSLSGAVEGREAP